MFKKNLILVVLTFLSLLEAENSVARTMTLNNTKHCYSVSKQYFYLGRHIIRFNRFQRNPVILTNIETTDSIANIFTPNGDGINDVFKINGLDVFKKYNLKIFNRWGLKVFETETPQTIFWDGRTLAGLPVPDGTYYYIITGENSVDNGFITVLSK